MTNITPLPVDRAAMLRQFATLAPPPPEMQQLFAAVHRSRAATDAFVRMNAGSLSPAEFFAPRHVASIFEAAARDA